MIACFTKGGICLFCKVPIRSVCTTGQSGHMERHGNWTTVRHAFARRDSPSVNQSSVHHYHDAAGSGHQMETAAPSVKVLSAPLCLSLIPGGISVAIKLWTG